MPICLQQNEVIANDFWHLFKATLLLATLTAHRTTRPTQEGRQQNDTPQSHAQGRSTRIHTGTQ